MIDISKYRKTSSFYKVGNSNSAERDMIIQQAIQDFDIYQKYSPNTDYATLNGGTETFLATFLDVSDLEIITDTKWVLTSMAHKIYCGDIIEWRNKKWICMYDKEKSTGNCYKVKAQPCTYRLKFATYEDVVNKTNPFIYEVDSILTTFLNDIRDLKQSFPMETGTTFIQVPFNQYTNNIKRGDRLWINSDTFTVGGIDFTNVNYYVGKGILKLTLKPDEQQIKDNEELMIANYYDFFARDVVNQSTTNTITISPSIQRINMNNTTTLTASNANQDSISFVFADDNTLGCMLKDNGDNSFVLYSGSSVGILKIKMIINHNPSTFEILKLVIE